MHLVPGDAVHDDRALPLQERRPLQVALLVEARLHLHQHRHLLARLRRPAERGHDRRLPRHPVQRHLDRQHVGIVRGLLQQVHDGVERLVGVVQHAVARADHVPDRLGAVQPERAHRFPRLEPQAVEPRHVDQAGPAGHVHRPVAGIDVRRLDRQLGGQGPAQLAVGVRHLHAHRHPSAPRRDDLCHGLDEVVVAQLVHLCVTRAGDAEPDAVQDAEAGKQQVGVAGDQVLQQRVGDARALPRDRHQPVEGARQRHHGDDGAGAGRGRGGRGPCLLVGRLQQEAHVQPQARQRHALLARDAHRGEGRVDLAPEVVPQQFQGAERVGVALQDAHAGVGQRRQHPPAQAVGLAAHDALDAAAHLGQPAAGVAGAPQRGHAHHEELVQVGADDTQEAQALQQRRGGRVRPVQHAAVERQPAQRAVEIACGRQGAGPRARSRGRGRGGSGVWSPASGHAGMIAPNHRRIATRAAEFGRRA